jgi:Uma2 family endonuclease
VPVYWIVDVDARVVEVWTPGEAAPAILDEAVSWRPDPDLPGLTIDLRACFREVWCE